MPTWLLIAICVICWGVWAVVEKQATRHASPLMVQVIGAYVYSAVAPILFVFMKATNTPTQWNVPGVMWTSLACVLATLAGLSFTTAIQRAPVHTVIGYTSTYPVLTFALCALFLGEQVTWTKLAGIVAIVLGTVLLSW
jgi:uncharacterized membrane protein